MRSSDENAACLQPASNVGSNTNTDYEIHLNLENKARSLHSTHTTLTTRSMLEIEANQDQRSVSAPAHVANKAIYEQQSNSNENHHYGKNLILWTEAAKEQFQNTSSINEYMMNTVPNYAIKSDKTFSILAKSDGDDDKTETVSINELVKMEYAKTVDEPKENTKEESVDDIPNMGTKDGRKPFQTLITMTSSGSSVRGGEELKKNGVTLLDDFRKDFRSSIKTLSLILMYLLISLPIYVAATAYLDCYCEDTSRVPGGLLAKSNCKELRQYMYVFSNLSLIGHVVFPCTWLFFDKMYADKLFKLLRIIREN